MHKSLVSTSGSCGKDACMTFVILNQSLTGMAISSCHVAWVINASGNLSLSVWLGGPLKALEEPWPLLSAATIPFLFFSPSVSTEIIRAERINIHDISTNSATVQWRPVLSGLRGYYEVRFGPQVTQVPGGGGGSETGTSPSTGGSQYQRLVQPADSSTARLTGLKPDTTYTVTLIPESNEHSFNALTATFTTKPG